MDLSIIFNTYNELPESSANRLQDIIESVEYPKKYLLFEENKKNRDLYFISKGIARVYCQQDINEVTLQFASEGEILLSLQSYIENTPGYENIELIEPCILYHLSYTDLQLLYEEDIHIANWSRKFVERELIKMEQRLISLQFKTAKQRYSDLIKKYPSLLQRVQLGHIASYLGISQVTLSRIRAEIR